jgi:hypothetical protein
MRQLALAALLFLGCSSAPKPPPEAPADGDWCAAAEARLEKLDTCRTAYEQGGVFLDPQCIAEAGSCQEANACPAQ